MMISAFGPYISLSLNVRLDHVVIYSIFAVFLITNNFSIKKSKFTFIFISALLFLFLVPFLGLILFDNSISNTLVVSQIENYLQPFAIVIICVSILHRLSYDEVQIAFLTTLKLFLLLMVFNTMISILIILFPEELLWRYFTNDSVITTINTFHHETTNTHRMYRTAAELARLAGRVSGVFTQIFEAGYAYSVALITWAYLYNNFKNFMRFQNLILLFILFGGFLASSKIFIIFGLGLFIFSIITKRFFIAFIFSAFVFLLSYYLNLFDFFQMYLDKLVFEGSSIRKSFQYIQNLMNFNLNNFFQIFTGGRFLEESSIIKGIEVILNISPYIGNGYGSIANADFSLYEVIAIGGLINAAIYLSLFLMFLIYAVIVKDKLTRSYYFYLIIITIFSSLAAPAITANRISLIFWIIFSFILMLSEFKIKRLKT